jgi:acyl transferase domain-containing protein/SAM-dependent methyltransferase/acyl carrier protein
MVVDTPTALLTHDIAIVGMAGRFPRADTLDELWELLAEGKSTAEVVSEEKHGLRGLGSDQSQDGNRRWGNFLQHPEVFDHEFFRISPREAQAWDPQQRILLEVAYEALESSGYFGAAVKTQPDDYGCYIGAAMNNYYDNVACHEPTAYATVGTSRSFTSGTLSHFFGWSGPAITMDTACSSSLVAINAACKAIVAGECSRAVAGGTNVITSPYDYRNLGAAGFLSPTGQCKPFDADGDGYCRAEGVGLIVLKSLATAVEENDHILGTIASSAVSQSLTRSQITVPNGESQVALHRRAMRIAGLNPNDVSYIEAHGTGTSVGDPIEMSSIREAFCPSPRSSTLHVASIKGNIGHTEASAGVAGLIKVLLMMSHDSIPEQANHTSLNPRIPALEPDMMVIPRRLTPWCGTNRVACVTSYGAAGSNATLLVRAAQGCNVEKRDDGLQEDDPTRVFPLYIAAASESSLITYCSRLLKWVRRLRSGRARLPRTPDVLFNIADRTNHTLPYTMTAAVCDLEGVESSLISPSVKRRITSQRKPVILVFGDQTRTFVGLSPRVPRSATVFDRNLETCHKTLLVLGHRGIYPAIFQLNPVTDLVDLHAALFATQYSCAKAWIDSGLKVDAIIGHSFGQLAALCVSGVLSLADALKLVIGRASLMQRHWGPEPGCMLSVRASHGRVSQMLSALKHQYDYAEIACHNSPDSHVIVGSTRAIEVIDKYIDCASRPHERISKQKLAVNYGFHSMYVEEILPQLTELARGLHWKSPSIHLETCDEVSSLTRFDHHVVASHARQPVYFWQAIERLAKKYPGSCWLSTGEDNGAVRLAQRSLGRAGVHSFHHAALTNVKALDDLAEVTLELWKQGQSVQYWPFHRCQRSQYRHVATPPYSFDRHYHWLPFTRTNGLERMTTSHAREPLQESRLLYAADDAGRGSLEFVVSPSNQRFRTLCKGHVMSGNALAPASLYVELAVRAATTLLESTTSDEWAFCAEKVVMQAALGLDKDATIGVSLKRVTNKENSWTFCVTSRSPPNVDRSIDGAQTCASGSLSLQRSGTKPALRVIEHLARVDAVHRYEQLVNDPAAENMRGRHVYRAFKSVVDYSVDFHSVKSIACVGTEAAGVLQIASMPADPAPNCVADTIAIDGFMQPAGFLANYFTTDELEEWLYICESVGCIDVCGRVVPDREYCFHATMQSEKDGGVSANVYVFDKQNMVSCVVSAIKFARVRRGSLARKLASVNGPLGVVQKSFAASMVRIPSIRDEMSDGPQQKHSTSGRNSISCIVLESLSSVTGIPQGKISWDASLEDIGCDSLAVLEVIKDVRASTSVMIPLSTLIALENVGSLIKYVEARSCQRNSDATLTQAGDCRPHDGSLDSPAEREESGDLTHDILSDTEGHLNDSLRVNTRTKGSFAEAAYNAFLGVKSEYDSITVDTQGYWKDVFPAHKRLVQAYIRKALDVLGIEISPEGVVSQMEGILPCHHKLVRHLARKVLSGGECNESTILADRSLEKISAEGLLKLVDETWPEHRDTHRLMEAIGTRLAECLTGRESGLEVLFGDPSTKRTLEDFYESWPLFQTPIRILTDTLSRAVPAYGGTDKIRVLEVGAGTGGATGAILATLRASNTQFSYCFTDVSPSLVHAAKALFSRDDDMTFAVLDIEQDPPSEFETEFHVIVAANCVHATRNLNRSLANLRRMLREDGVLTLVEITQPLPMFDLVFGPLEGWWLFNDGREHVLVNEKDWERQLLRVGFDEVLWSDGQCPESEIVRTIAAFPSLAKNSREETALVPSRIREVRYKTCDNLDLLADVYCPVGTNPDKRLPVGKCIEKSVRKGESNADEASSDDTWRQSCTFLAQGHQTTSDEAPAWYGISPGESRSSVMSRSDPRGRADGGRVRCTSLGKAHASFHRSRRRFYQTRR